ncbi:MAG: tetraacyldisaccharide 4'-kinase [Legionella sp.]
MQSFIDRLWYGRHPLQKMLLPVSLIYTAISRMRRSYLERFVQQRFNVPIIVIGNISVGGVGKTPLVIAIAKQMTAKGIRVGIVSRGYGAQIKHFPYEVGADDNALLVGDEPLLMAQRTGCPVVIAPKRTAAVEYLLTHHQSQIILSDDGLQHYKMARAIEIAVIDGVRGLGNGFCLPAGPLREPESRLNQVDLLVVNEGQWHGAHTMTLQPGQLVHLTTGESCSPTTLNGSIMAVAGIGNPQRFYSTLQGLDIEFTPCTYPDHYQFSANDLNYSEAWVIMTEKDAVKCRAFASERMYYLPVEAALDDAFWNALWSHQQLKGFC